MAPTRATPRKSYTAAFKLEVSKYAEKHGNRAAGREYNVSEKCVRDWRKKQPALLTTKKTKRADRGRAAWWAGLEDKVEEWILEQRG